MTIETIFLSYLIILRRVAQLQVAQEIINDSGLSENELIWKPSVTDRLANGYGELNTGTW